MDDLLAAALEADGVLVCWKAFETVSARRALSGWAT
jgi:hypothetical protein